MAFRDEIVAVYYVSYSRSGEKLLKSRWMRKTNNTKDDKECHYYCEYSVTMMIHQYYYHMMGRGTKTYTEHETRQRLNSNIKKQKETGMYSESKNRHSTNSL